MQRRLFFRHLGRVLVACGSLETVLTACSGQARRDTAGAIDHLGLNARWLTNLTCLRKR